MAQRIQFVTLCMIFGALIIFQGNSVIGKSSLPLIGQDEFQSEDKITHHKRRYWIDELSDCIDMYCKKYINSELYVKCMLANCPDGILITSEKRSRDDYPDDPYQGQGFRLDLEMSSEIPDSVNSEDLDFQKNNNRDVFNDQTMFLRSRLDKERKFDRLKKIV